MSKVSFDEFSKRFAEDLEIDDDHYLTANLKDVPQYDSMGKITISLTIERLFGFQIAYEVLDAAETVQSLYELCRKQGQSD
jgi:acyl carrier protein